MTGPGKRRRLPAVLMAAALVAGCTGSPPRRGTSPPPLRSDLVLGPNVLIVLTDDQHPSGTMEVMPETRKEFEEGGTTYTHTFLTTPLCCPSRASILSGRYAHNHGVLNNARALNLDQGSTIARYLHDAGYTTAIYGKFLNRWPLDRNPPSFDRWGIFSPPASSTEYVNPTFNLQGRVHHSIGYSTDIIEAEAEHFLVDAERDDRRPWFLYLAPSAPHRPYTPAPRDAGAPVPGWPGDPAVGERDRSDKPPYVRDFQTENLPPVAELIRRQQRTLLSVDRLVAGVFDALRSLDEDRQTLAFFLTDNGYEWGEHGLRDLKNTPYTESTTTPLFVRWPGHVRAGARDDRIAANIDIAPTILQVAGIHQRLLYDLDGRSLLTPSDRDRILLEYWADAPTLVPNWASIRTPASQYIETYADDASTVTFREYYDLRRDPFQLDNLLGDDDPENDPNTAALSRVLQRDRSCTGDACP